MCLSTIIQIFITCLEISEVPLITNRAYTRMKYNESGHGNLKMIIEIKI